MAGNAREPVNARVLLLGSGELGKEIALEFARLGVWVCAADSYAGAPAQLVAPASRVLDMTNPAQLEALIEQIQPSIIVPEIEAIATDVLRRAVARSHGALLVAASAEAISICMDREKLRTLAAHDLGLPTTPYRFAGSLAEMHAAVEEVGTPCVIKPVMSSSGHGQSTVTEPDPAAVDAAWDAAQKDRRAADSAHISRVIVEAFAPLAYELTVLTVSSTAGVVCCPPIGQRQEDGDYRESWQPATVTADVLKEAHTIATTMVEGLRAVAAAHSEECFGVFGVELFVVTDGTVLFNEVSPRPHDTGLVTLASQNLSECALHARALLGAPVTHYDVALRREDAVWASRPLVAQGHGKPFLSNVGKALSVPTADLRIFGKPTVEGHRRLAVGLANGQTETQARERTAAIINSLETRFG